MRSMVQLTSQHLLNKVGDDVKDGFPEENSSMLLALQWKMRNKICFYGKKLHNPLEIVSHACALMKF